VIVDGRDIAPPIATLYGASIGAADLGQALINSVQRFTR